jgi:hypothetical protein
MAKILDVNGDVIRTHHFDHSTGVSHVETSQNIAPYLEQNLQERLNPSGRSFDGMKKIASIPIALVEQWNVELGDNCLKSVHRPWFMAKIRSRDFSKLRTVDGKV